MENKGEIVIFKTEDNQIQIDVRLDKETVWLTQEQMSILFQRDRTVITRHVNNIFKEGELKEKSNVQKMHFPFSDKKTKLFTLDVIISVGYRVKSQRGTQFRIWANKVSLNNNFLVALTLMIANSKPSDKNLIVKIVSVLLLNRTRS